MMGAMYGNNKSIPSANTVEISEFADAESHTISKKSQSLSKIKTLVTAKSRFMSSLGGGNTGSSLQARVKSSLSRKVRSM